MQSVGFAFLLIALAASVFGLLERWKNKRVLATPFRRTGEIAANRRVADAQGNVSCEGPVRLDTPAYAPCSGRPCLYYEIEVVQSWTKLVSTENGVKARRGRSTIDTVKSGVVFYVDDGSGPVAVDPRYGLDVELEETFEQEQLVGYGDVQFNDFHARVLDPGDGKIGESIKVIERIVPIDTHLYVLGQLDDESHAITKPKDLTSSLLGSRRGRNHLIRRTKRHAMIGTVAAAVFMFPGLAMAAFGAPPDEQAGVKTCLILDQSVEGVPCTGQIYGDYGSDVMLTVVRPGVFEIVGQPPAGKNLPLIAQLDVKDATGHALVTNATGTATVDLAPGTYTINIRDRVAGSAKSFKGGYSYELAVKRLPPPAVITPLPIAETPVAPPRKKTKGKRKAKR